MKPYNIPRALESLIDIYPDSQKILEAVRDGDISTQYALARLWLSEGIPYCFRAQPAIYESMRLWLSRNLSVRAKELTLIGSGRQGYSLSPDENFGRPFGSHSDLDWSVISLALFKNLEEEFFHWKTDYVNGVVTPKNNNQIVFWQANSNQVPKNIYRGFIDPHKIPTFSQYPVTKTIHETLYKAKEKLHSTPGAPHVKEISLRVYCDWDSFIRQLSINLEALLKIPISNSL